jgi:hypothetical protein
MDGNLQVEMLGKKKKRKRIITVYGFEARSSGHTQTGTHDLCYCHDVTIVTPLRRSTTTQPAQASFIVQLVIESSYDLIINTTGSITYRSMAQPAAPPTPQEVSRKLSIHAAVKPKVSSWRFTHKPTTVFD